MLPYSYISVSQNSYLHNEHNDCAVRAVSITTQHDYADVHAFMKAKGRRNRCGTPWHIIEAATSHFGGRWTRVKIPQRTDGAKSWTMSTIGKAFPKGRFMVYVHEHIAALVDGKVEDWTDGRRHRVQLVFQVSDSAQVIAPKPAAKRVSAKDIILHELSTGEGRSLEELAIAVTNATGRATKASSVKNAISDLRNAKYSGTGVAHNIQKSTGEAGMVTYRLLAS